MSLAIGAIAILVSLPVHLDLQRGDTTYTDFCRLCVFQFDFFLSTPATESVAPKIKEKEGFIIK